MMLRIPRKDELQLMSTFQVTTSLFHFTKIGTLPSQTLVLSTVAQWTAEPSQVLPVRGASSGYESPSQVDSSDLHKS